MSRRLLDLPPLDLVRSFVAVARCMSITAAAQELCVTQSAVSRQIRALEAALGCALFVRGHRRIELTLHGQRLFRSADVWLEQLGDAIAALRPASAERAVSITASIGVMSLWLLPRIGAFQSAHSDIDLQLVASARLVDLERENVDLAIRYYSDTPVPAGAIRLFGEQLVPVAHRSLGATDIETREQLARHVLLEFDDPSHPELQWSSWLRAHRSPRAGKPARSRILRFNQYDQVVQATLAGHGVALGRLALVAPLLRDGKLTVATRIPPVAAASAYWLLSRQPASRTAGVVHAWILRESA